MQRKNFEEYQQIRREIQEVKNCITTYMGFVLGGSGAALFGFNLAKDADMANVGLLRLGLSTILLLVLFILVYKFNSHNRYAGYCKLLNQEKWSRRDVPGRSGDQKKDDPEPQSSYSTWETCVSRLRAIDLRKQEFKPLCNAVRLSIEENTKGESAHDVLARIIEGYADRGPKDSWRLWKGLLILPALVTGVYRSRSWRFPLWVALVFASLTLLLLSGSASNVLDATKLLRETPAQMIAPGLMILFHVGGWAYILARLHTLMNGSATVDAYCWKFLPIRASQLRLEGVEVEVREATERVKRRLDEVRKSAEDVDGDD